MGLCPLSLSPLWQDGALSSPDALPAASSLPDPAVAVAHGWIGVRRPLAADRPGRARRSGGRGNHREHQPSYLDDLRLYLPDGSGGFHVRQTGDLHPFATRDVPARGFVFRIDFPDATPQTLYLRVQTSSTSLVLPHAAAQCLFSRHDRPVVGLPACAFRGVLHRGGPCPDPGRPAVSGIRSCPDGDPLASGAGRQPVHCRGLRYRPGVLPDCRPLGTGRIAGALTGIFTAFREARCLRCWRSILVYSNGCAMSNVSATKPWPAHSKRTSNAMPPGWRGGRPRVPTHWPASNSTLPPVGYAVPRET